MAGSPFKLTIHMVASLDGIIAKNDNSIEWFEASSQYDKGAGAPDVAAFLKTIDCYVMGGRTYELALELSKNYGWAYGDTPTIVLSHKDLPIERKNIELYNGDLTQLVNDKLKPAYRSVWVVGGPAIVRDLIDNKLADEVRMSILPIILGEGLPFFGHIAQPQLLQLKDVTAYKNGMVELWYEIKK